MELIPSDATWHKMCRFFGLNKEVLHSIYEELGVLSNLKGEIQGDKYLASNGNTFSYDAEKQRIDGSVIIEETVDGLTYVKGFPLTTEQRKLLEKHVDSIPSGSLHLLFFTDLDEGGPVLQRIDDTEGTQCISSSYKVHFVDADGVINFLDPSSKSDLMSTLELIENLDKATQVVATSSDVVWLDSQGRVWGCGKNEYGQLGPDHMEEYDGPVRQLPFAFKVVSITASDYQTIALDEKGSIWILGTVTEDVPEEHVEARTSPRMIEGFQGVKQVVTEGRNTYFLDAEGNAWHFDSFGDYNAPSKPTRLDNVKDARKFFVGFEKLAYLDSKGSVWFYSQELQSSDLVKDLPPIKDVALGFTEESAYDVFLDTEGRAWLMQGDSKPKLFESLKNIKQVSSGYATAFIA